MNSVALSVILGKVYLWKLSGLSKLTSLMSSSYFLDLSEQRFILFLFPIIPELL